MSPPDATIVFVHDSAQLGEAELALHGIASHFADRSRVLLFDDGPLRTLLEVYGVSVEVIGAANGNGHRPASLWRGLAASPQLLPLIRRTAKAVRRYDLIFANSQMALAVAAVAGRMAKKPVIWHLQDIVTGPYYSRSMRMATVRLANWGASRVIANSMTAAEAFVQSGGREEAVRVIYGGVDERPFPAGRDGDPDPELDGLEPPLIGLFGPLSPARAQHVAIWAVKVLGKGTLVLVGDRGADDEVYREQVEKQVQDNFLQRRVRFLDARDDVPAVMKGMDIILHTSTVPDPFGRGVIEGMLAGRPVIATAGGAPSELIEDGESGLLVEPESPRALAVAIQSLIKDPTYAIRLARQGRDRALWHFTLARTNPQIDAVIRELFAAVTDQDSAGDGNP